MPILQSTESFGDTFPPVLARSNGGRHSYGVDLDIALYPTQKIFPPGFFAGTHVVADKYRLLPRTKITATSATAIMAVTPFTAAVFVVGDVLTQINLADGTAGTAVGTVASVNHAANTVTLAAIPGAQPTTGTVIGFATSRPVLAAGNRVGVLSPNTALDLSMRSNTQFAAWSSATLYRGRMPHIDTELERLYPELNFV